MLAGDASPSYILNFLYSQLFLRTPRPTTPLHSQTIIITGSNTGLGYAAAQAVLDLHCAHLIMAVRSLENGEAARRSLIASTSCDPSQISVWHLDLESYPTVVAFAARCEKELDRIDILLLNAAVVSHTWNTVEGNERMLTVNIISTFLLAFLLLPQLRSTAEQFSTTPRLTFVASDTHFLVDFEAADAPEGIFNRLNDRQKTLNNGGINKRYMVTKLMQVWLMRELAARVSASSTSSVSSRIYVRDADESATTSAPATPPDVIVNCTNPGLCHSAIAREIDNMSIRMFKYLFARSAEMGARSLVAGAVGGVETHGAYMDLGAVKQAASVVIGARGVEIQRRLYEELVQKLEGIVPDVCHGV